MPHPARSGFNQALKHASYHRHTESGNPHSVVNSKLSEGDSLNALDLGNPQNWGADGVEEKTHILNNMSWRGELVRMTEQAHLSKMQLWLSNCEMFGRQAEQLSPWNP